MHRDDSSDINTHSKQNKKGIIYLSALPKFMNVTRLREIMENFGKVGRIFLQPQRTAKKKKPAKHFTEGWVEFEKKRVAKEVARGLNNRKIQSKKRSELYDFIWNIKYLSRFKWIHLSERVAYERAVRKHRMRVEISQAKKEATDFSLKVNRSEKLNLKSYRSEPVSNLMTQARLPFPQKKTEEEYLNKKNGKQIDNSTVLKSLFC